MLSREDALRDKPGVQTTETQPQIQPDDSATSDRKTFNRFVNDLHSGKTLDQMSPAMRQWWRDRYRLKKVQLPELLNVDLLATGGKGMNPQSESFESFKRVTDMTFIIGPPGPTEDKQKFEQWSTNSGKPAREIWIEYVHDVVSQLASRNSPDSVSDLDKLVSRAVGVPVCIEKPFLTFTFSAGEKCPVVMLYMNKIFSPNGELPAIDWSEPALRQLIGSIFGSLFKAEWVRAFVAYV